MISRFKGLVSAMGKTAFVATLFALAQPATFANAQQSSLFDFNLNYAQDVGPVNWTGFIFNPSISYTTFEFKGRGGRFLDDADGFRVGAEIGFDKQIGSVVVGVAGDIYKSWNEGTRRNLESEVDIHGTIRGRLGYSFDRLLAYGTAGLAYARVRVSDDITRATDARTMTGFVYGGGLEYVYNKNITIRAEYLYSDYDDANFSSLPVGSVNPTQDQFNIGLVTRF